MREAGFVGRRSGEEVGGDGDGQGRTFFRVSGRAEFIEEDERTGVGEAREAVEGDDMRGEGG